MLVPAGGLIGSILAEGNSRGAAESNGHYGAKSPWAPRELVLWGALAIALSLSWVDLARHWADEPWARPSALFLALGLAAAAREDTRSRPRGDGYLLLAAGLGMTVLAVGGGEARLGRPGLALAIFGMARALGRPSAGVALLALWVIPPPFALSTALSPGLERGLAELSIQAARTWGLDASLVDRMLEIAGMQLKLRATDGGLPLCVYLAGIGWWTAVWRGGNLRAAARAAIRLAPLGLVAQVVALVMAFALLAGGAPNAARAALDIWPWPVLALALLMARPMVPSRAGENAW